MFREIREWIHLLLIYGLLYSTALIVFVFGVIHLTDSDPLLAYQQNTSPKVVYKEVQGRASGYEPGVCNRIDGCVVKNGVCLTCEPSYKIGE